MKKIFLFAFTLLLSNCNAQQIINLENKGTYRHYPLGAYFKDINNFLNPFIGTYIYTNGNTSLKIILDKKIKDNGKYAEDVIYGGYEYIVNGVTIANTLPNTLPANTYAGSYYINGNAYLLNNSHPPCSTCTPGEKRLFITLQDTQCIYFRRLIIKREVVSGQEQIKIDLDLGNTVYYNSTDPEPVFNFALPSGSYTLIKQ
ncbi:MULTISPECIES: DUF6705 family protein [Flavobacterium]|uniref:DUF6705 domain-containing protein n=1 Tax=Flavobacterium hankyongi TaxID=1176532 RepID=A0ABP9A7R5_9FLAO|nr:DUF6705 family protein [Flavobacterium sp. N1846]